MSDLANAGCDSCGGTPHQRLTCDGCVDDAVRTAVTNLRAENVRLTARVEEMLAVSRQRIAERDTARAEAESERTARDAKEAELSRLRDETKFLLSLRENHVKGAEAEVESLKAGNAKLFHQNTDLMTEVDDLKAALADSVPMEMFDSLKAQLAEAQRMSNSFHEHYEAAEKGWLAAEEQLRVTREALKKHGVHLASCDRRPHDPRPCSCGLDAALSASTPKAEHVAVEMGLLACTECEAPPHEGSCPEGPTKTEPREVIEKNSRAYRNGLEDGAEKHRADLMRVAEAVRETICRKLDLRSARHIQDAIDLAAIVSEVAP